MGSSTTSFVTVTAVTLLCLSPGPGAEAITDDMFKVACSDMTPRHPGFQPENLQRTPSPYRLFVDKIPVVPGDLVNLTLTSFDENTPFKGFMVQARDANGKVLGTFLPACDNYGDNQTHHMITCSNGVQPYNTAVQSTNNYKYKEIFTWVAPISLNRAFRFKYTVVHDFEHYWTNEETDDIPITSISPEEYKIKSSSNHEYYVYKLFIKNCFS